MTSGIDEARLKNKCKNKQNIEMMNWEVIVMRLVIEAAYSARDLGCVNTLGFRRRSINDLAMISAMLLRCSSSIYYQ